MTGRQRKSAWISANWPRVVGIPRPEDGEWMLRDTPLNLSVLCDLKSRNLVETLGKKHVMGSETARETVQKRYRTKDFEGPYEWFDGYSNLPRSTFEKFAARPDADLFIVTVEIDDVPKVAPISDAVKQVEIETGLDVQVVTVTATAADTVDASEYPGRVIEVERGELTSSSSNDVSRTTMPPDIIRAIPSPDILSVTVGPEHADAAPGIIASSRPEYRLINSDPWMFVSRAREFIVTDADGLTVCPRPPRDRPDHPQQRMLSHFDPGVLVDDEVRLEAGEDGQTTLDALSGPANG